MDIVGRHVTFGSFGSLGYSRIPWGWDVEHVELLEFFDELSYCRECRAGSAAECLTTRYNNMSYYVVYLATDVAKH